MDVFLKDPFIGEKTPVLPLGLVNEFSILNVWFMLAWPLIYKKEFFNGEFIASEPVASFCKPFIILFLFSFN